MPVTTDACILGAAADLGLCKTALDVGTGTGLLSLMLAQRYELLHITALELQEDSCKEAAKNFQHSPWSDRLELICTDALLFNPSGTYDGIICNPPFFDNQLASEQQGKSLARHTAGLNYNSLMRKCAEWLSPAGVIWLLIPELHLDLLKAESELNGFYVQEMMHIFSSKGKPPHVCVLKLGRTYKPVTELYFVTYDAPGIRSQQLTSLMKDYYI